MHSGLKTILMSIDGVTSKFVTRSVFLRLRDNAKERLLSQKLTRFINYLGVYRIQIKVEKISFEPEKKSQNSEW